MGVAIKVKGLITCKDCGDLVIHCGHAQASVTYSMKYEEL